MKHCGTKQIETKRLILRRFRSGDEIAMYENWASDPEVTKYLTWPTHTNTEVSKMVLEDWINSYEKEDYYQWAIVPKDNNNTPIGSISIVGMKFEGTLRQSDHNNQGICDASYYGILRSEWEEFTHGKI